MKFKVREGFVLFRGENAGAEALAYGCRGTGPLDVRPAGRAGKVVALTHRQLADLSSRQLGMLEAADDEAGAYLRSSGIIPTPVPEPPPVISEVEADRLRQATALRDSTLRRAARSGIVSDSPGSVA